MFTARNSFFCFLISQRQGLVIFLFHNTEVTRGVISTYLFVNKNYFKRKRISSKLLNTCLLWLKIKLRTVVVHLFV